MDNETQMLIHAVKAIQYRFIKATNCSKEHFGEYKVGPHTRTPNEITNHIYDLVNKTACRIKEGHFNCPAPQLLDFSREKERLLSGLEELIYIINTSVMDFELWKKLLQGPVLDIATHIGQIAMLNGLHGNKIPGESYFDAILT
ncbi:hypothetical protein [Flavihumibacter profundi]|uniref:hypothetical protein n=1 Tax=Flavihumibacter profundi TaxID=2716883 RepID=UPI001CC720AB|nr:hypothetical protein [Flavihumibacter profundi]MBZ5857612.1 hypothetical protein [Flavihumibacter profundi]